MVAFFSSSLLFLFLGASVVTGASMLTSDLCSGVRAAQTARPLSVFKLQFDPRSGHGRLAFRLGTSNRSAEGTVEGSETTKKESSPKRLCMRLALHRSECFVQHALNSGPSIRSTTALHYGGRADVGANYGAGEPAARRRYAISAVRRRSAAIALVLAALPFVATQRAPRYRPSRAARARSNPVDAGTLAAATYPPTPVHITHPPTPTPRPTGTAAFTSSD